MVEKKSEFCLQNREITHRYEIIDKIECGIELKGTEVKSVRNGKANLKDSFAVITPNLEVVLKNMHISHYDFGNINNVNETRDRRLLIHKKEALKLKNIITQNSYTLVPSKLYLKGRWFKMTICICKGKKIYDNRDKIEQSMVKRQINYFKKS